MRHRCHPVPLPAAASVSTCVRACKTCEAGGGMAPKLRMSLPRQTGGAEESLCRIARCRSLASRKEDTAKHTAGFSPNLVGTHGSDLAPVACARNVSESARILICCIASNGTLIKSPSSLSETSATSSSPCHESSKTSPPSDLRSACRCLLDFFNHPAAEKSRKLTELRILKRIRREVGENGFC